jgi:uncharacterized protein YndB with AHSA1/START domain
VTGESSAAMPAASTLEITRLFDAPQELVFKVWSSAEHVARWLGPKDFTCSSCKIDFRPGGSWRAAIRSPEGNEYWFSAVYRQITPPSSIALSFHWEQGDELDSEVTVTFAAEGNKTRMIFVQTPFKSVESRDSHEGGWGSCFDRLVAYAEQAAA